MYDFIMNDFEPSSAAAWKQKIQFELQGADYNKTLLTKTNEGITIKPFYHLDNFEKVNVPTTKRNLKVCQKIEVTTEQIANTKALNAIKKGSNALKFISKVEFNFETLFNNLLHKNIELHFQLHFISQAFISKLTDYLKNETIYLNIDIIGNFAKTGNWYTNINTDFKVVEHLIQKNASIFTLSVNANIYQNAGANTVQQTAYALAHANEYLTYFGEEIADKIQFNFSTGSNYFFEIAKIRAFRYLYSLILTKYNTTANAQIYSEPSIRNKTLFNSDLNSLRSSNEIMSAILGGTNTSSNESNQNLILNKWTNHTQQLCENSYYIESITKQIAEKALAIFKDIEKSGGFLTQLKEGTIQRKIKESADKEQSQFEARELILVGTNKYLNQFDSIKAAIDTTLIQKKKAYKTLIIPITAKRLAEKMELKRLKGDA